MSTKELLIECGLSLFSKASYDRVGVQEIVDAAKVTKPTLYHHFGSKLGFYEAVYQAHIQGWMDEMTRRAKYKRDLVHNLNQLALCTVDYFMADTQAYYMFEHSLNVSEVSENYAFVSSRWRPFLNSINSVFEAAVEQHGNLRGKAVLCAWLFVNLLRAEIGYILNKCEEYRPDLPYKFVHQFMYGIFS